jgi:hypothetical protein
MNRRREVLFSGRASFGFDATFFSEVVFWSDFLAEGFGLVGRIDVVFALASFRSVFSMSFIFFRQVRMRFCILTSIRWCRHNES